MQVSVLQFETTILGGPVLKLSDWESVQEIVDQEQQIVKKYRPIYIYLSMNATDLNGIHALEQAGYRFSEFRIHHFLSTSDCTDHESSFYPYRAELIGKEKHVEKALTILKSGHADDRFSNDPLIGQTLSQKRMIEHLLKSANSYPHEFLFGLINTLNDELIAFRSGAFTSAKEVFFYQYGVSAEFEFDHYSAILDSAVISRLKKDGIEVVHAVSTGFNIIELNRFIKKNNFRILSSEVVMKKTLFDA